MPDRKKVMSWLEGLTQQDWRMFHSDSEVQEIARNALELLEEDCHNCKLECLLQKYDELKEKYDALLKEQEPIAPKLEQESMVCGVCGHDVIWQKMLGDNMWHDDYLNFCPNCGRAVKWE